MPKSNLRTLDDFCDEAEQRLKAHPYQEDAASMRTAANSAAASVSQTATLLELKECIVEDDVALGMVARLPIGAVTWTAVLRAFLEQVIRAYLYKDVLKINA